MVYVFDCLALAGRDMRGRMLLARRSASAELVANMTTFRALCFVEGKGKLAFDKAVAEGAQAIVAKRARSTYQRGQQSAWIKIRNPKYTP